MHDLACSLRPGDRGSRAAADPGPSPTMARQTPFAPLVPDWQEMLSLDLTTNATSEEGCVSSLIYGPFRIDEIAVRSGSAGGASQQVRFYVGDDQPAATTVVSAAQGIPSRIATDSARSVATLYATNAYERHALRQTFRTGTARIAMLLNNTTGAGVTVVAQVTITHLKPACERAYADEV